MDSRVTIRLQPKAWVDTKENVLYLENVYEPVANKLGNTMLIQDNHEPHTTEESISVRERIISRNTQALTPKNLTDKVQAVDRHVGRDLKRHIYKGVMVERIKRRVTSGLDEHISAKEKRILVTKLVGEWWELAITRNKKLIETAFLRTDSCVRLDGSEDKEVQIQGLKEYDYAATVADIKRSEEKCEQKHEEKYEEKHEEKHEYNTGERHEDNLEERHEHKQDEIEIENEKKDTQEMKEEENSEEKKTRNNKRTRWVGDDLDEKNTRPPPLINAMSIFRQ